MVIPVRGSWGESVGAHGDARLQCRSDPCEKEMKAVWWSVSDGSEWSRGAAADRSFFVGERGEICCDRAPPLGQA